MNINASAGVDNITAAATTAVKVVDTANGLVTVTGGSSQTVSSVGAATLSGATGAISLTETGAGQLGNAISVDDGSSVTVASKHQTTGTITIGNTTPATGDVVVTTGIDAGATGGLIKVTGGTTVTVTENVTNAVNTTVTAESAVTVIGTAATTTVSVTQGAVATASAALTAITGVAGVGAIAAGSGQQAVAVVTAVNARTAVPGVAGVTADGVVMITDSGYNTASANTITSVTLANYAAVSVIDDNALSTLSLSGSAGTLTIHNATNGGGGAPTANTTLALTVNGLDNSIGGGDVITDTNAEITTLNVTTAGAASKLDGFVDGSLTTLTVAGDQVLTFGKSGVFGNATLTSVAVSGAAGFKDSGTSTGALNGFAALGAAATFTTTSSGAINLDLNTTSQTFVGSTGKDTITILGTAEGATIKTVTGGSGTTDELILGGAGAYALTLAKTGTKVTGFETLGVGANLTGTVDMATLAPGFTGLDVIGGGTIIFSNVAANTALAIDANEASVTYGIAGGNGAGSAVTVNFGSAATDSAVISVLALKDANNVGIGTLNFVSNGVNITAGDATPNFNTITTLTDNGLANLNVSGTQGLVITGLNEVSTQATGFTINNTNTGSAGVTIGTLTDAGLGSLTFTGTGASTVTSLAGLTGTVLSLANTGTGAATVTAITPTASSAPINETNTVTFQALSPGQSVTVDGRTVSVTSGTALVSAAAVAAVMLSGVSAGQLTSSGPLGTTTVAAVSAGILLFTSTTLATDVVPLVYSSTFLAAGPTPVAGAETGIGAAGTANEVSTFAMPALTEGQSYTVDGETVTATANGTTAANVATVFAGGAVAGLTLSGLGFGLPASWASVAASAVGANLLLTDGTQQVDTAYTATPTTNAAGTSPIAASFVDVNGAAAGVTPGNAQALTSITLTGNVALGVNDNTAPAAAIGAMTGITVSGSTDNAHVNITLNAAAPGATNSTTLGNGNNFVTDLTTAGTAHVTVGTGYNLINVSSGGNNTTYHAAITLGAHTDTATLFDAMKVSVTSGQAAGYSTVITGASTGDVIVFADGAPSVLVTLSAAQQAVITADVTLAAAIGHAFGDTGVAHDVAAFTYGGATYIIENVAADAAFTAGTDSVVQLVGTHTIAAVAAAAATISIAS